MSRAIRLAFAFAFTAAIALVVVMALQARSLRSRYDDLRKRVTEPHAGIFVPTFDAVTLEGNKVRIGRTSLGGRQVLFIFTTTCPFCRASIPYWKQIAASVDTVSEDVEVYGIAVDSISRAPRYVLEHRLPFPVLGFPERKLSHLYRASWVPLTMVLDSDGRVVYARRGVIESSATVDSVIAAVRWKPVQDGSQKQSLTAMTTVDRSNQKLPR